MKLFESFLKLLALNQNYQIEAVFLNRKAIQLDNPNITHLRLAKRTGQILIDIMVYKNRCTND